MGLRYTARRIGVPHSTLENFLNGRRPTGERRQKILAFARRLGRVSQNVPRETPAPTQDTPPAQQGGGVSQDYFRGVVAAAERMSAEVTAILRDARIAMSAGAELPSAPGGQALAAALEREWDLVEQLVAEARARRSAEGRADDEDRDEPRRRRASGE